MKALLLKDYFVITKTSKLALIILPLMVLMGGGAIASLVVLMGVAFSISTIGYDEQSKWNEMAVMMPYTRTDMVLSKYLFGYLSIAGAAMVFTVIHLLVSGFRREKTPEIIPVLLISVAVGLIMLAVDIPIVLRFGSQKGRLVFIGSLALMTAIGTQMIHIAPDTMARAAHQGLVILFGAAVVVNIVSIALAMRIRKE